MTAARGDSDSIVALLRFTVAWASEPTAMLAPSSLFASMAEAAIANTPHSDIRRLCRDVILASEEGQFIVGDDRTAYADRAASLLAFYYPTGAV